MPIRKTPLITDYYYHIFNRSVAKVPIYTGKRDFSRAMDVLNYYRFSNLPLPYSQLKKKSKAKREEIMARVEKEGEKLLEIACFCLMPNHFHLLVKQKQDKGIADFIRKFQDSYAKFFNIKYKRSGPLFESRFNALLVETDDQILHLSRYIHLNPYTSFIIKEKEKLLEYSWFSLPEYLDKKEGFCETDIILGKFKSSKDYLDFIFNRADYQRSLGEIKHLLSE